MTDKTEAPTPRRLEEAREKGQVARSQELNTAVVVLVSVFLLRGPGNQIVSGLKDSLVETIAGMATAEVNLFWIRQTAFGYGSQLAAPLGMFTAGLLLAGVAVTMAQTRFLWSSKKIGFDFNRVNPLNGFKRIFSMRGLVELARAILKLGLVGWMAYSFLRSHYHEIITLGQMDFSAAAAEFASLAIALAMRVGGVYVVLAAVDYAYQRWDTLKQLKMTKQEIKEEHKRSEGDPFLKGRIRSQQRRMARNRMMANVPKATVVVTNPTHLAIAIEYQDGMRAPKVLAKGALRVAERIVAIAKENRIPIVQNIPLARAMYKTIEVDQEISPDLYMAMAEVLAYVYNLRAHLKSARQTV